MRAIAGKEKSLAVIEQAQAEKRPVLILQNHTQTEQQNALKQRSKDLGLLDHQ